MFFAMNSIFIGIATMLYVFNISKAKDEDGREIVPEVDFRGFIRYAHSSYHRSYGALLHCVSAPSHPVPFKCDIAPRSEEAAALVRRAVGQL